MKRVLLVLALLLAPALVAAEEPVPEAEGPATGAAFVIPIEGVINPGLVAFVRRGIETARDQGATQLIFEIDTEGGRVDSAISICQLIDDAAPIPTAAYVKMAWSAGALISLATDRIYMDDVGTIGSAAPVSVSPQGSTALGEKYVAALRAEFRAWAERKGYPATLAVAMVDLDLIVLEVEVDGERRFLTPDDLEAVRRERAPETDGTEPVEGVRLVRKVIDEGKLLHLTARQAVDTGFASGIVASRAEIVTALGAPNTPIRTLESSWSETLVQILTHPSLTGILMMAGLAGLYLEMKTPGFGVPGILGLLCLALFFGSGYLVGLAEVQDILLFGIGVVLLVLEIFLFPGFGVLGLAGLACMVGGLLLALQTATIPDPDIPWEMDAFRDALTSVTIGLLGSLASVAIIGRLLPSTPGMRRLVLSASLDSEAGYTSARKQDSELAGQEGVAVSDLRPVGTVRIDERTEQAMTSGEWVERGSRVRVVRSEGNRIIVEPVN